MLTSSVDQRTLRIHSVFPVVCEKSNNRRHAETVSLAEGRASRADTVAGVTQLDIAVLSNSVREVHKRGNAKQISLAEGRTQREGTIAHVAQIDTAVFLMQFLYS